MTYKDHLLQFLLYSLKLPNGKMKYCPRQVNRNFSNIITPDDMYNFIHALFCLHIVFVAFAFLAVQLFLYLCLKFYYNGEL